MLPVIFGSITLKYTNQTLYSAIFPFACSEGVSWMYKRHLEEILVIFWASYVCSGHVFCLVGHGPFDISSIKILGTMPNSNVSYRIVFSLFIYVAGVILWFTSCKPKVTPYINNNYITELSIHTYIHIYIHTYIHTYIHM